MRRYDEPDAAIRRDAMEHTRRPVWPASLSSDGRDKPGPPPEPLPDSYARQQYVFTWRGARALLDPTRSGPRRGPGRPQYFVSAANPAGALTSHPRALLLHEHLRKHAVSSGLDAADAVTFPPERGWFDPCLLIRNLTRPEAVDLGRTFAQPAVIEWCAGVVRVIPTGLDRALAARTMRAELRPAPAWCPVRDDERVGAECIQIGGPWTGASIHASALFQDHRRFALGLLGCGVCTAGRPLRGEQSSFGYGDSLIASSRYGGTHWPASAGHR